MFWSATILQINIHRIRKPWWLLCMERFWSKRIWNNMFSKGDDWNMFCLWN